jgi:type IV pilus assembly protein PilA
MLINNKKKGFTLVELLAVIVILAIIALIATPLIMNVIDDAKMGAFKSTAYGIIKSAEFEYASNKLLGVNSVVTYTYEDGNETSSIGRSLQYKEKRPQSGIIKIDKNGNIALAIHDGIFCAKKVYNDDKVTVTKKVLVNVVCYLKVMILLKIQTLNTFLMKMHQMHMKMV